MAERICIGKISSAHGVKGLVKIFPLCEDYTLLHGTHFVDETSDKTLTVTLKNPIGKFILAEIEGITNREDAQLLKTSLYASRDILPEIADDEIYVDDMIGLIALDGNGETIGTVIDAPDYGAGILLDIKPANGQAFMVPLEHECVGTIDTENRCITITDHTQFIIE